jgi:methyl-accepting chemotaxis protein
MAEIASASAEQSIGIEQVNQALTQMDDVTQQNAALVEHAAAAAASLEDQADMLAGAMGKFRLDAAMDLSIDLKGADPSRDTAFSSGSSPNGGNNRARKKRKSSSSRPAKRKEEEWDRF